MNNEKIIIDEEICKFCGARECAVDKCKIANEFHRKEQECKRLKEKIESYVCSANYYKYKKAEQYRMALEDIRGLINNPKNCVADIIYYSDKIAHDALQEGKDANIQS